jgi:hypothetical protein
MITVSGLMITSADRQPGQTQTATPTESVCGSQLWALLTSWSTHLVAQRQNFHLTAWVETRITAWPEY